DRDSMSPMHEPTGTNRGNSDQIGCRSGIDHDAVTPAVIRGELNLKRFDLLTHGEIAGHEHALNRVEFVVIPTPKSCRIIKVHTRLLQSAPPSTRSYGEGV